MKDILGAQMRAARALLRWAAADLVRESGVSLATIHRAESVDGKTAMTFANTSAIRRALENAGVELIDENGWGTRGSSKAAPIGSISPARCKFSKAKMRLSWRSCLARIGRARIYRLGKAPGYSSAGVSPAYVAPAGCKKTIRPDPQKLLACQPPTIRDRKLNHQIIAVAIGF